MAPQSPGSRAESGAMNRAQKTHPNFGTPDVVDPLVPPPQDAAAGCPQQVVATLQQFVSREPGTVGARRDDSEALRPAAKAQPFDKVIPQGIEERAAGFQATVDSQSGGADSDRNSTPQVSATVSALLAHWKPRSPRRTPLSRRFR